MDENQPDKAGLSLKDIDLVGLGKLAKAIPPEVYKQTTKSALRTFESLVAPFTQTTDGVGRLIRQTFDNWVEVRKALGTYALKQALIRAKARADKQGQVLLPPAHPKTFIRALEESSEETDSVVHDMWVNLLASQFVDRNSHPRFVSILSDLAPEDARLLTTLKPRPEDRRLSSFVGGSGGHSGKVLRWVSDLDGPDQPWNLSVTVLCQHSLAEISPRALHEVGPPPQPVLLFLTQFGEEFLAVVAPTSER